MYIIHAATRRLETLNTWNRFSSNLQPTKALENALTRLKSAFWFY